MTSGGNFTQHTSRRTITPRPSGRCLLVTDSETDVAHKGTAASLSVVGPKAATIFDNGCLQGGLIVAILPADEAPVALSNHRQGESFPAATQSHATRCKIA
ncbi:hypothetical protein K456DRAFT_59315 [Colletotrichum gloeosporioides 23]|nr:hypothetical protein K456DRAFT_59315 [Colletotrichum gloeosporioides 23]